MTKTEAIDLLDNLIGFVEDNQNNDYDTALKMAIEALSCSEEPNRSEPKTAESGSVDSEMPEIETDRTNDGLIWKRDAMKIAETLRDCISVDGYWAWIERVRHLPSAQPERKKGEWFVNIYKYGKDRYECSECSKTTDVGYDFCPNCGADMRGENND